MPQIGQAAPDFTLFAGKGEQVSLSDYRGKKVVVAFFPAAFSGVCEKELCTFRDSMAAFEGLNAQVVAISVDGLFPNMAFKAQNDLSFPVLSDHQRQATQAYGVGWDDFAGVPGYVAANRSVFVVDEDGILRWSWVAPNPGVEPDYDAIQAALG